MIGSVVVTLVVATMFTTMLWLGVRSHPDDPRNDPLWDEPLPSRRSELLALAGVWVLSAVTFTTCSYVADKVGL